MRDAVRAGKVRFEAGSHEGSDDIMDRGRPGADICDDVPVLADLRRHPPVLEGVQQNHLPTDEGPPERQLLAQVEQHVPQLVDRRRQRRQLDGLARSPVHRSLVRAGTE